MNDAAIRWLYSDASAPGCVAGSRQVVARVKQTAAGTIVTGKGLLYVTSAERRYSMKFSHSRRALALAGMSAVAAVLLCLPAGAAIHEAAQAAVWVPKELHFTYMGFTSKWSCDGLRDKMRQVLLELGARKDIRVYESPCSTPSGRPDPFPGVTIKMNVLVPAEGEAAPKNVPKDAQVVSAHWKTVELPLRSTTTLDAAGECELVEQIKHWILPSFQTRNVEYRSNCIPHQASPGGTFLRTEVLVTDQKQDAKKDPNAPA